VTFLNSKKPKKREPITHVGCGRGVLGYALCVFRRRMHLLSCFWRRLLCFCPSGGGRVSCLESTTRQVWLGLYNGLSTWCPSKSRMTHNLSDEGGLLRSDSRLCGAVVNFFSEPDSRSFGLDDSGGSLVSVQRSEKGVTSDARTKVCTRP
jgi:hypothetical protein